jgi:O-acetyl-ADP-ribose deacetylase
VEVKLIHGDITKLDGIDCIVNAANTSLLGGGGVDGAIHRNGGKAILDDCLKIRARQGGCKVGNAVLTTAGKLSVKYIIHTVGPKWVDGNNDEDKLLERAYLSTLSLADKNNIESIAFPNISTGIYGYPKEEAAKIAIKTVREYIVNNTNIKLVIFICYDLENYEIYNKLLNF